LRVLLLLLLGAHALWGASARSLVEEGNAAYEQERFEEALELYRQAAEAAPDAPEAHFNRGDALYRSGDHEGAVSAFERAAQLAQERGDDELEARSRYNLGNAFYQEGRKPLEFDPQAAVESLERSVRAYREALRIDPELAEAAENLELAKRALKEALVRRRSQPKGGQGGEQDELQKELSEQIERQKDLSKQSDELDKRKREDPRDEGTQQESEQLSEQQKELEQKSRELSEKMQEPSQQEAREQMEQARQRQQQASQQLQNQQTAEASESQREAAERMQQALDALEGQGREGEQQQAEAQQQPGEQQQAQPQEARNPQDSQQTSAQMLEVSPQDILDLERSYRKVRQQQTQGGKKTVEKDW